MTQGDTQNENEETALPLGSSSLEDMANPSSSEFNALKGEIVAFLASRIGDTFAYLKRVGDEISPGMQIFENVGLNGSSLAVSVSDGAEESENDVLKLRRVWRVHGVLRTAV
jgi:hypothetical protein